MGACFSSRARQNNENDGQWRSRSSPSHQARQASEPCADNYFDPNASSCQPQRRPEMEIAKIKADRNLPVTSSGLWLASPVAQHQLQARRHSLGEPVASIKTRKRSLGVALHRVSHRRRRTASERQRPEWRVSLRSFGTRSPFPDFACYALAEVPEEDTRSSITCVEGFPAAHLRSSRQWPLPDNESADPVNTLGDNLACHDTQAHGSFCGFLTRLGRANGRTAKISQRQRLRSRARAISDPFRYATRKRTSTQRNETGDVNAEINELRVLVAARKKQTTSVGNANANATSQADTESSSLHQRDLDGRNALARTKSRGHVPAIAPNMKMSVRSQVLSDIGSAFSRPLNSGDRRNTSGSSDAASDAHPRTPPASEYSVEDLDTVSNVSPLPESSSIGLAVTNNVPSKHGRSGVFHSSSASSVTCSSTAAASASQRTSAATTVSMAPMERSKLAERRSGAASVLLPSSE